MARQESYQGLARKWRPQRFEDLVGQEAVAQSFQSALRQGRVVHGHMLAGPRGVGKTTSARILAKALNCEQGATPTPCGTCRHCIDIAAGNDMDVIEIDAASNTGVDNIRELRERVTNAPFSARYKVYIIDEIHMLSTGAFNALLKTLEEPPPQVIFIFATTELDKVPETIRSRCVQHTFRRMSAEDIARRLEQVAAGEGVLTEPAELREVFALIARAVEGGMRDALVSFDQLIAMTEGKPSVEAANRLLGLADQGALVQTIDWLTDGKAGELLKLIEELSERGRNLERFVKSLIATLRDLMLLQATGNDSLVAVTGEALATAKAQARRIAAPTLFNMLNQLFELEARLKQSTQTRFLVEFTLLRIAAVRPVVPLDEILARVQALPEAAFSAALPAAPPSPPPAAVKAVEMPETMVPPPATPQPVSPAPPQPIAPPAPRPAPRFEQPAAAPVYASMMNDSMPPAELSSSKLKAQSATATDATHLLAGLGKEELLEKIVPQLPDSCRFLNGYLRQAAAIRAEGGTLRIEWSDDATSRYNRKKIEKPENQNALERVVSALAGTALRVFSTDAAPGAPTAAPPPAPAPAKPAHSHSLWAHAEQAEASTLPPPPDDLADQDSIVMVFDPEDDDAPGVYAAPLAEPAAPAPKIEEPPADKRSALEKAQDLMSSSDDAARRIKMLQEMLGGRLIDENGQPLPA